MSQQLEKLIIKIFLNIFMKEDIMVYWAWNMGILKMELMVKPSL